MKKSLKNIDKALFANIFQNTVFSHKLNKTIKHLDAEYPFSQTLFYNHKQENMISFLCDKYGSDKGSVSDKTSAYQWHAHTYADFYFNLFNHCRLHISSVFECGLGTNNPELNSSMGIKGKPGASLRVWQDYFPNAKIYGADIDKTVLFTEDRISTFYVDQTKPFEIDKMWNEISCQGLDLIIDDGLHTYEAGISFFEGSISHLKSSGIYVIEDVRIEDIPKFKSYFHNKNIAAQIINLNRPYTRLDDNSLIVIRNT